MFEAFLTPTPQKYSIEHMHKNIVGYIRLHRNRKAYVSVMSMVKRKTYRGHSSRVHAL